MQIILTEKIRHLGDLGTKVTVKDGYARNFLIPKGKAVIANADNLHIFETKRAELEKKAQVLFTQAEQRARQFHEMILVIPVLASEEGKLYGSVGTHEIREALKAKNIDVTKREIVLPQGPFHEIGEYKIEMHLHTDLVANLQIQIVAQKSK